jgi:hypothetical protein
MTENTLTLSEKLKTSGEHLLTFSGEIGHIEAALVVPENADKRYVGLLGHPHSLQGGTMNNKVVTTMARAFKELNIISLRFNFRGVGQSAGVYEEGVGESEDMLFLAHLCQEAIPDAQLIFAGFSFGSYVAYRAAAQQKHALLITVAPSVQHYNYAAFSPAPTPWFIVQGDEDEVVPSQSVIDFATDHTPAIPLLCFAETGHFFHGKLIVLKERIIEMVSAQIGLK